MLLIFVIIVGAPVALALLMLASWNQSYRQSIDYAFSVASTHHVQDVVTDGVWTAGIDPDTRVLVIVGSKGRGHRFTYDHVASVELTPIYEHHDAGTATTTSNRGSQLISAGVGAAIAGPAGLVVGGLSGSRTTTHDSVSTAELDRIELKIRLYFDDLPVVKIVAPSYAATQAERLAARLANAIDQRGGVPKVKDMP